MKADITTLNFRTRIERQDLAKRWRRVFSRRRQRHDPLLLFHLAIFNSPNRQRGTFANVNP